jgi:hypothetical protein
LYTQYHNEDTKKFADEHGINAISGVDGSGLNGKNIVHGGNSGHQAMCLAYLLGATSIYLLGYDMQRTGGKSHFFGEHPKGMINGNYAKFLPQFNKLATDLQREGVEVINCTRQTALTQFRRAELASVL